MIRPKVSLVVPCYNQNSTIKKTVENFLSTDYPNYEIIIIDDCSNDGTYEILLKIAASDERLKLYQNASNSSASFTRNNGLKKVKGKYVGLLETDMAVESNWLYPLVDLLEADKSLGAVQSKVLDLNKRDRIHSVGVKFDPHTFFVKSLGTSQPRESITESEQVCIGAVGSLIRKNVLDKVGDFDEKIVHNIDDIDLGWRICIAGYKIVTVPQSITYHWSGKPESIRAQTTPSAKSEFYFHKTARVFLKNYELKNVLKYLPWLYLMYTVRVISGLWRKNPKPLKGFIRASLWNISNLPNTLIERKRIQSLRKTSDSELLNTIFLKGNMLEVYYGHIKPTYENIRKIFG